MSLEKEIAIANIGVMDGGIDTAKSENVGFYGPFASVSAGIGG